MAIEPTPLNMMKIQTEITAARAQRHDLQLRRRKRELLEQARVETVLFALAHRVRDQLLTAPARQAAVLAAELKLDPAAVLNALDEIVRRTLVETASKSK